MNHQVVGYIRISSVSQNTDRQLQGLKLDKEFIDVCTGSVRERKALIACIDYVREGDTLVVDSIDRLARNLRDLQEIVGTLLTKGVSIRFVKENLLFTSNSDPISTLMLHMMGAFAEFERNMIRTRQREGIELAKKKGKHLGPPIKLKEEHRIRAMGLRGEGMSIRKISMTMGISRGSVYKLLKRDSHE